MIPIVQCKFSLPRLSDNLLERAALLARLEEGLHPDKRLTLVSGGAGFGKTTLLAQYARRGVRPVFWYALDASDRDPMIAFFHVIEGLKRVFPDLSSGALELLNTVGPLGTPQAMGLLCDDLVAMAPPPFVFVLDNVQNFPGDRKSLEALEVLIKFLPDQAQLILSGRAHPPVRIARYKIKGQVLSIDDSALCFTIEELSNLPGQDLEANALAHLHDRTRGWITGIQYALRDLESDRLAHPQALYDFFAEEVFDDLPTALQDQLLQCAHLPAPRADTCLRLFGEGFLSFLTSQQAFIGQEGDLLRFHPIFLEFLRSELFSRWPRERRRDHFRWLAEDWAATPLERVEFLLLAEDWPLAEACLIEELPDLLDSRRYATIKGFLARFPIPYASPWHHFAHGEIARCQGDLEASIKALEHADSLAQATHWESARGRILASLAAAWGARGEAGRQHAYVVRALDVLPPEQVRTRAFCQNVLGIFHLYRHELARAHEAFEHALSLYRETDDLSGQIRAFHNLALTCAKGGDFERSIAFCQESIRRAEASQQIPLPLTYNNMAAAHLYLDRLDEAQASAEQGLLMAERLGARRDRAFLLWTFGELCARQGKPSKAREHFEASLKEASRLGDRHSETSALLGLAELAMRLGEFQEAQFTLDRALGIRGLPLDHPEMIDAAILQAELNLRNGAYDEAAILLFRLSDQAAQGNHYRSFLLDRLWYEWHVAQGRQDEAATFVRQMQARAKRFGYPLHLEATGRVLEVASFGTLEVCVDGHPLTSRDWRSAKAKLLLVYLMCHPSGATKEELLNLLYPEADATRSAIHVVVTRLRQALEPNGGKRDRFIRFENGRYLFDRRVRYAFDLETFRERLHQANDPGLSDSERFVRLESAVKFYRGPFMADFTDSLWVQLEQEHLRQAVQGAYEALFHLAVGLEHWQELERLAEANLNLDPCCEAAFRAKIVALAMQERLADARRTSTLVQQILLRELAVGPEPLTQEVMASLEHGRLLAQSAISFFPDRRTSR